MQMSKVQEWAQPFLILVSYIWSLVLPYDGIWISFTFLGLLHFLTQISWLHDRRLFFQEQKVIQKQFFILFGALCAFIITLLYISPGENGFYIALLYASTFIIALFLRLDSPLKYVLIIFALLMFVGEWSKALFLFGILLPTVIHVGIFTLCFLIQGALRRGDYPGIISAFAWIIAVVAIFIFPHIEIIAPMQWFQEERLLWEPLAQNLSSVANVNLEIIFSFLTFIYTYHFLNWFSKTEVLKWHKMSPERSIGIAIFYVFAIFVCYWNYMLGYLFLLLPLSILHVVLEFPLDVQVLATLPKMVLSRVRS